MQPVGIDEIVVTTGLDAALEEQQRAQQLARHFGCLYVERRKRTITQLCGQTEHVAALVVEPHEVRFVSQGQSYGFHPNMAMVRIKALLNGQLDRFIEAAQLQTGDRVLDCTCGLGADATVAAFVVGAQGAVLALEASPVLAAIVSRGMQYYQHQFAPVIQAMRQVQVRHESYTEFLATQPERSWDVVYFDPMFDITLKHSQGLELVRLVSSSEQPTKGSIEQACRVARRSVVVADRMSGPLLKTLHIPIISAVKRVWYGRIDV